MDEEILFLVAPLHNKVQLITEQCSGAIGGFNALHKCTATRWMPPVWELQSCSVMALFLFNAITGCSSLPRHSSCNMNRPTISEKRAFFKISFVLRSRPNDKYVKGYIAHHIAHITPHYSIFDFVIITRLLLVFVPHSFKSNSSFRTHEINTDSAMTNHSHNGIKMLILQTNIS